MKIHLFKNSLKEIQEKDEILEDLMLSKKALVDLLPTLQSLEAFEKKSSPTKTTSKLTSPFNNKFRKKTVKFSSGLRSRTEAAIANIGIVESLVETYFPGKVASMALTTRQVGILSIVTGIDIFVRYTSVISAELIKTYGKGSDIYSTIKTTALFIKDNRQSYIWISNVLTKSPVSLKKEISGLSDLVVSGDNEALLSATKPESGNPLSSVTSNFYGNPIYHMRNIFAGWKVAKYKSLRDEKKQLELLLIQVESSVDRGGSGANIEVEKEIIYIEDRIELAKLKMRKIEKEINDE